MCLPMTPYLLRRLKEMRVRSGLSQTALAAAINVQPSFVSHIEAGRRSMNVETLEDWVRACGGALVALDAPVDGEHAEPMRPDDAARVLLFAAALRNLPELPPGSPHPGDLAVAVVTTAGKGAAVGAKPGRPAK